jgi:predicted lipid-binding transport protein (Tim44 family)
MRRNRRIAVLLIVLLALALVAAPTALAAAGGGSSGFGGGGGGGGRGIGLYILIQILIRIAILGHGIGALVLIALIILAAILMHVSPSARSFATARSSRGAAARRRTDHRERSVELAAAEAAEDDPAFAPFEVRSRAIQLFEDIQAAWDKGDRAALDRLVAPGLGKEWHRRLDDFERRGWRNRVELLAVPTVKYVGLTHRGEPAGDSVVVRIEAKLRDYVEDRFGNHFKRAGGLTEITRIREYWTLTRRDGRWVLASIEEGAEGEHALHSALVPTPWSDHQSLRDEALIAGAVADAVPATMNIAELADLNFEGDARAAALDLSLADGRFAPDVLEAAARRAVRAWALAVDGDGGPLRKIARPSAVRALLHPGDRARPTRVVVRDPQLDQIRIVGLDAGAQPPTMTIELEITGRRYIQDRDTAAIVAGSQFRPTTFTERWTLALAGPPEHPWRITDVETQDST